jgi:hypothetical protein
MHPGRDSWFTVCPELNSSRSGIVLFSARVTIWLPAGPSGPGCWFRSAACEGIEMRSWLATLFYIDYKCATQPGFRKTLLVLTLIFVFLLSSPWRPLLCPVFGVCPAPVARADIAPQLKPTSHRVKRLTRLAPVPGTIQNSTKPSVQPSVQP